MWKLCVLFNGKVILQIITTFIFKKFSEIIITIFYAELKVSLLRLSPKSLQLEALSLHSLD